MDRGWLFTQLWQALDAAVLQPIAAAAEGLDAPSPQGMRPELDADVQVRILLHRNICASPAQACCRGACNVHAASHIVSSSACGR